MTRACQAGLLVLLMTGAVLAAARPEPEGTSRAILIHADGTVTVPTNAATAGLAAGRKPAPLRYGFGLPAKPPEQRWLEDDTLPIFQTSWELDGIRYTQRILMTSLGTNEPAPVHAGGDEWVLLVQIAGHNTASEYAVARAVFEVKLEDQPLELELREGLVFVRERQDALPLGAVEVASEGVAGTEGAQLRFQGDMPPGISGSMTIKIPLGRLEGKAVLDRLLDLEFDEEVRRVKRAWKDRPASALESLPLTWARPTETAPSHP